MSMNEYLSLFFPPDHERVAFVVGIGDRVELWPTPNTWRGDRRNNYTFSTAAKRAAQIRAAAVGGVIVGHAHAHIVPNAHGPSEQDLKFLRDGELGILFDLPGCQIITYRKAGVLAREPFRWPRKYTPFWVLLATR